MQFKHAHIRAGKAIRHDGILNQYNIQDMLHVNYTFIISSPEHEVLMVSYCGQWLSVVVRRASCVVRRPSTFDVYTLETTFVT